MNTCRKILIVGLYLFDTTLHGTLVFGWSSISLILKKEGFFGSEEDAFNSVDNESANRTTESDFSSVCSAEASSSNLIDQEIGLVMTLTTSLLGVFLLFYGFLRDYLSFGICRLVMYIMLCLTYLLLAISRPYESDNLQYLWIFQMGSGIGLFLNEIQFLNLFPANVGFLIGACNALCNVGSFFPLAWKIIIENGYLSYSEIMWIWLGLTLASLIVGTLIYPWHNVPQDTDNVDENAYQTAYEVLFKSEKRNIVTLGGDNPSLFQQLKENAAYLKSPLFPIQMILFAVGNCTVSLSLNLVNDLICRDADGDTEKFNKTQQEFEIVRAVVATAVCILIGFATDFSMKFWNKTESKNKDVQKSLVSYFAVLSMNLAFAISLFGKEIWATLVILTFCNGLVYCYECTGIAINFPNSSQGVIFALVELTGSLFNFVQIPITEQVKGFKNFVPYEYFELGMSLCTLITLPFILWIAMDKSPAFVTKLDADRRKSILPVEKDEAEENMKKLGANKASEKENDNQKTA